MKKVIISLVCMSLYTQYVHAATSTRWSSSNPALQQSQKHGKTPPPIPTRPTKMPNPNLASKHSSNNPVMRPVVSSEDREYILRQNHTTKPVPKPRPQKTSTSKEPSNEASMKLPVANFEDADLLRRLNQNQTTKPVPKPRPRTNSTSKEPSNEPVMRPVVSSEDREYILRQNPTNKPVPKPRPTRPTPPARPTRPTKSPSKQNIEQQPDNYDTSNQALKDQWDNHPTIFNKRGERIYFDEI